ncbi:uncharacterized protein RJT20DRAFT_15421 [Scheffersomyces xylosifermentans]|uniref:uncharacterized protein n=1 Tax=Scheffersomyces xylosifermentans TaxID=1304137 RepID=UPI00315D4FD5
MSDDDYLKALEIQRRNFEAQFGSIEDMGFEDKAKSTRDGSSDEGDSDSDNSGDDDKRIESDDFGGFDSESGESGNSSDSDSMEFDSDDEVEEEVVKPKVVKLNDTYTSKVPTPISKADRKLLRSGRAATLVEIAEREKELERTNKKRNGQVVKEEGDNLENDLKLQRLLQESHILANTLEYSGAELTLQTLDFEDPTGKARKRALDSRIRNIASTNSATGGLPKKLEKMPMSMRKGMIRSREQKIAKYEEDAKNAGIVLSKVKKGELRNLNAGKGSTLASDRLGTGKKIEKRVRDRGLKINGIGRSTRNGLIISQGEIDRISNQGYRNKKKGKGRR